MATTRTPQKTVAMCCVTVGHSDYLLPANKGMELVKLMQEAFACRDRYEDGNYVYDVLEQPRVELKLVRPNQIRMPQGSLEPFPLPTRQRLLK